MAKHLSTSTKFGTNAVLLFSEWANDEKMIEISVRVDGEMVHAADARKINGKWYGLEIMMSGIRADAVADFAAALVLAAKTMKTR